MSPSTSEYMFRLRMNDLTEGDVRTSEVVVYTCHAETKELAEDRLRMIFCGSLDHKVEIEECLVVPIFEREVDLKRWWIQNAWGHS